MAPSFPLAAFLSRRVIILTVVGLSLIILLAHQHDNAVSTIHNLTSPAEALSTQSVDASTVTATVTVTDKLTVTDKSTATSTVTATVTSVVSAVPAPPKAIVPKEKYAFATFMNKNLKKTPDGDDGYFTMARMLAYRFLHDPKTKTQRGYPFLVLVSEGVAEWKIEQLRKDGATIVPVKRIISEKLKTKNSQWWDQLTKLRLWELTKYDKIAYFDMDTVIHRNMDDIFNDEAATIMKNLNLPSEKEVVEEQGGQPSKYMFAGNAGAGKLIHPYPQPMTRENLNAGCFVLSPSVEVMKYYMRVMEMDGKFNRKYMEQSVLSYAHRWAGNMPWKPLNYTWNTNYVTMRDVENDIASLHVKYWETDHDPELKAYVYDIKSKMTGFFMGRESVTAQ